MKKKIALSLAVIILLTMAFLTACESPQNASTQNGPSESPQTSESPDPTPSPALSPSPPSASDASPTEQVSPEPPAQPLGLITLATTTSTDDSGLLDFILPVFTAETGWDIQVISVGTGAALQLGRDGEADVLLVHARAEEDRFVAEGYAERRYDVMYNDFVVVGPIDGPIDHSRYIVRTFTAIWEQNLSFVSRGDNSGTHIREMQIWTDIGLNPTYNSNYIEVGQGMGATLGMAVEMEAYTLADRATWLAYPNVGNLVIVCEGSDLLLNPYGVMVVSSTLLPIGAQAFVDWIRSPTTQELIGTFGLVEFGQPLFFPDA